MVADIAAGPGTLRLIAAAGGATVSAVDLSSQMVAQFRARIAAANLDTAVDVRVGDGQQLPFETAAFDAAFSMFGLMFFPDRAAGLREMKRVLKPGGRAVDPELDPVRRTVRRPDEDRRRVDPRAAHRRRPPAGRRGHDPARADGGGAGRRRGSPGVARAEPSFDAFWNSMQRTNAPLVLIKHRVGAARW